MYSSYIYKIHFIVYSSYIYIIHFTMYSSCTYIKVYYEKGRGEFAPQAGLEIAV